jgi:hypothetical protein
MPIPPMYINIDSMYIGAKLSGRGESKMAVRPTRTHKHFQLDSAKIKRAQKALGAKTETETLERALDSVIAEERRNRVLREANREFFRSGIEIKDVYGVLDK